MNGITPVIAAMLLLLIAVAIIGKDTPDGLSRLDDVRIINVARSMATA